MHHGASGARRGAVHSALYKQKNRNRRGHLHHYLPPPTRARMESMPLHEIDLDENPWRSDLDALPTPDAKGVFALPAGARLEI